MSGQIAKMCDQKDNFKGQMLWKKKYFQHLPVSKMEKNLVNELPVCAFFWVASKQGYFLVEKKLLIMGTDLMQPADLKKSEIKEIVSLTHSLILSSRSN